MNKPILIGIILFLFVFASLILILRRKPQEAAQPPAAATLKEEKTNGASQRRINAKLFFNDSASNMLAVEDRAVPYRETLQGQAVEVLHQLMTGPRTDLVSLIPQDARLRELFITKDGTAFADFSPELAVTAQGGSRVEINTIYSIVNTLTLNFPSIKQVQILVDDRTVETLNGHLDLSRPLKQDLSLVRSSATSPPGAGESQQPS